MGYDWKGSRNHIKPCHNHVIMKRDNEFSSIGINETTRKRMKEIMDLIKEFDLVDVFHMDKNR